MDSKWRAVCLVQALAIVVLVLLLWGGATEAAPVVSQLEQRGAAAQHADPSQVTMRAESKEPGEAQPVARRSADQAEEPSQPEREYRSTVLIGRVVGSDGQPVAGAHVSAHEPGSNVYHSGAAADQKSAEPGRYAVPGLSAGKWIVSCRADGYLPFRQELDVPRTSVHSTDLVLRKAWVLKVRFVDENGKPQGGFHRFSAIATAEKPPASFPMTTLASLHGFGLGEWRELFGRSTKFVGQITLDSDRPVWVSAVLRQEVLSTQEIAPGQTEVDLVVRADKLAATLATVRVRVVDAMSGAPIEGARVSVADRQSAGGGKPTDADGRVVIENVKPGYSNVAVWAKERAQAYRMIRIRPGADVDVGDVRMSTMRAITGTISGPTGEPLQGVRFTWFDAATVRNDIPMDTPRGAVSTEGGKFTIPCGAGVYIVRARHDLGVLTQRIDTSAGAVKDVALKLHAPVSVPIDNRVQVGTMPLVTLLDANGRVVISWLQRAPVKGAQRPARLAPGRYTVEIRSRGELVRSYPLDTTRPGAKLIVP